MSSSNYYVEHPFKPSYATSYLLLLSDFTISISAAAHRTQIYPMEQGHFNQVAKKALEFRQRYYKMLDDPTERPHLVALYAPDVPNLCEWNGHPLPTPSDINSYFGSLPKTSHQVDTVDAQPLPGNENGDSILLTVHGLVTYDDEHKREFFQRFVLRQAPDNKVYIFNDYYRWLSER